MAIPRVFSGPFEAMRQCSYGLGLTRCTERDWNCRNLVIGSELACLEGTRMVAKGIVC